MADMELIKSLAKGSADIDCVKAGGIAVYNITADDNSVFQLEIDMTDTHDVGATSTFMRHYDRAIPLMRWFRRACENGTLIKIK